MSDFDMASDEWGRQLTAPYEAKRSAVIVKDDQVWGVVGEFKTSVRRALKLPAYSAGFEVHLDILPDTSSGYTPLSRFPSVTQDLTLIVPAATTYAQVLASVKGELDVISEAFQVTWEPISIYQAEASNEKSFTFRFVVANMERTLTDGEVAKLVTAIAERATREIGARV
jgi:phenylalanyl-tRNA synthetase beta chain